MQKCIRELCVPVTLWLQRNIDASIRWSFPRSFRKARDLNVAKCHIDYEEKRLESVQQFLRYLAFKSGRPMYPHDHVYSAIIDRFEIPS